MKALSFLNRYSSVIIGLGVSVSAVAFAGSTTQLVKMTADRDPMVSYLKVDADDQSNITSMRFEYEGRGITDIALDKLKDPQTLLRVSGLDVFKLQSTDFNAQTGGHFSLIYISNGLSGEYGHFDMTLARNGDSWALYSDVDGKAQKFNRILFKMKLFFNQPVGVGQVEPSYGTDGMEIFFNPGLFNELSSNVGEFANRGTQLLHVTSDAMEGYADLTIETDDQGNMVALTYMTSAGVHSRFTADDLHRGYVIVRESGYDIVKLKSNDFNNRSGGGISMIYTTNALTHSTGTFEMQLVRSNDRWFFLDDARQPFKSMFMKGNKFFGKTVGIKEVTVD